MAERLRQSRERTAGSQTSPAAPGGLRPQSPAASSDPTRSLGAQRSAPRTGTAQGADRINSFRSRTGLSTRAGDRTTVGSPLQTPNSTAWAPQRQQMAQAETRHESLNTRLMEHRQRLATAPGAGTTTFGARTGRLAPATSGLRRDSSTRLGVGLRTDLGTHRPLYLRGRYYDRPDLIRHTDRHIYSYYDPYHRLHHRVIWPSYYYPVYYPFGSYAYCSYVWPYYHRKYVFISLGGWWPYDYDYMRYYWYGYHPYVWYGYYPVASEVAVGSDNYYTYNYNYYGDDGSYTTYSSDAPLDPVTQARLRAQLEQQKTAQPAPQTLADTRFDEGVKSFEAGEYAAAAAKFQEAQTLSPNDMILPFAYAQALFAHGQYDQAADVLRGALKNVTPEKEGVFFPRGLYTNDDVLYGQIDKLLDKADQAENDSDLQLLLGYQLLGVGETGHAREQLEQAAQDPKTAESAAILLRLAEKMEKEAGPATQAGRDTSQAPAAQGKTEAPVSPTIGDMMSTAAQAGTAESTVAPEASAPVAPPTPPQETPLVPVEKKPQGQEEKPSDTDNGSTGTGAESAIAPAQELEQTPPKDDDDHGAGTVSQSDGGAAVQKAGFADSSAVDVLPGLSRLIGSHTPNYRADMVVFASILSLALAGVWIEWRFLGRKPV
ncbi:MAG: tetratricopeptide repeat protein [Planctomycetes bacterium]|nr:tetratricopeptide repeat protein [Planctomycetota bacterium]